MAEDAGALLVRSGLIAEEQLLIARQAQAGRGGTIGEHLVLAGFIEDQTLADFYRTRLMVPQVSPRQLARIPKHLISKIPADMATEFRCVPVAMDRDHNLTVAMADPSTTHTVDEIGFFTGHYVVRAVATPSQIAWCLAHYYGKLTPLGQKLMRNPEGAVLPGPMPPAAALGRKGGDAARDDERPGEAALAEQVAAARHHVLPPLSPAQMSPAAAANSAATRSRMPLRAPTGDDDDESAASGPVPVIIEPDPPPPRPPPPRQTGGKQRVISFLQEDTAPTGPMKVIKRAATNPPELIPRAGEFDVPTGPIPIQEEHLPAVMVSLRSRELRIEGPDHVPLPLPEPEQPAPRTSDDISVDSDEFDDDITGDITGDTGEFDDDITGDITGDTGEFDDDVTDDITGDTGEFDDDIGGDTDKFDDDTTGDITGDIGGDTGEFDDDTTDTAEAEGAVQVEETGFPPEPITEPNRIAPDFEPQPEPESEPDFELQPEPESEPDFELQPQRRSEPDAAQPDFEPRPQPRPEPASAAAPEPEAEAGPESGPESGPKSGPDSGPVAEFEMPAYAPTAHDAAHDHDATHRVASHGAEDSAGHRVPGADDDSQGAGVVLLDRPKGKARSQPNRRRKHSTTKLGMGFDELEQARRAAASTGGVPRAAYDPDDDRTVPTSTLPDMGEPADRSASSPDHGDEQAVVVAATADQPTTQMQAAPPYPDDWPSLDPAESIHKAAEAAAQAHARRDSGPPRRRESQAVPVIIEDDGFREEEATGRYARELSSSVVSYDDDDEWGPPGTTIPPGYLGAMVDADGGTKSATIPIATDSILGDQDDATVTRTVAAMDSTVPQPTPQATPQPMDDDERKPRRERSGPVQAPLSLYDSEHVTPEVLREFEASQDALAEVLRQLQLADSRDAVIDILTDHLSTSHQRVAFFAVKSGQLLPWKTRGSGDAEGHGPALSLDRPSTFQDIVGTRLPFRGPVTDRGSREFLARTFGSAPEHMLALPVSVRERVVGVLYGDTGTQRVFVQNLGVLARAAGGALERILKTQKHH